ncbi:MAG: T9SS type A sorting domain-containing protein [Flavobacteriales bacterium]
MRNFILLVGCFFVVICANAQITITSADMPVVNDTIRLSVTNNIQGKDPKLTGPSYVWDFSMLSPNSQKIDTFFSVTSTPLAYQYYFNNSILYSSHKASFAKRGQDFVMPPIVPIPLSITEVFNFSKNSTSKFENVGFGSKISGIPSSTRNLPIDVEYEFPLNYNDSNFSSSKFLVTIPSLAAYGQSMDRSSVVDGWGSLTTPLGTFNVLRVKSVLNKVDTFYLDTLGVGTNFSRPEEIEYKWLANGMSVPLLKIITTAGIVSSIEYRDIYRVVGVEEHKNIEDVMVYPNPTNGVVNIMFSKIKSSKLNYTVKDVSGKIVLTNTVNTQVGNNNFIIDFAKQNISKGIYFIDLKVDSEVITQKIIFSE